jgi:hypothetical protein
LVHVGQIEERFIAQKPRDGAEYLSAQAGAFAGSERERKKRRLAPLGMTVCGGRRQKAGQMPALRLKI